MKEFLNPRWRFNHNMVSFWGACGGYVKHRNRAPVGASEPTNKCNNSIRQFSHVPKSQDLFVQLLHYNDLRLSYWNTNLCRPRNVVRAMTLLRPQGTKMFAMSNNLFVNICLSDISHTSLCVLTWLFKASLDFNSFPQLVHWWMKEPGKWIFSTWFKALRFWAMLFPHRVQRNMIGKPGSCSLVT